ncbi:MAG: leucyl/phenylalanyl-tRNA--protein transferase, partial [Raineya sp.]
MSYYVLNKTLYFPSVERACKEGIVAIGGDLSVERLLLAYQSGIFPWFSPGDPIVWWSPNPRFVLYPEKIKVSKSMKQLFKKQFFRVSFDTCFEEVITNCANIKREGQSGTWITKEMKKSYCELHNLGYAHSVEVWQDENLVGGLYGVALGKIFFGESMFSKVSNASKYGFITLTRLLQEKGFKLIDCQVHTEHLESLGAEFIERWHFIEELEQAIAHPNLHGSWSDWLG